MALEWQWRHLCTVVQQMFELQLKERGDGNWLSIIEHSRGVSIELGLNSSPKAFNRKLTGKFKTHHLEVNFNHNGRYIILLEVMRNLKFKYLVIPASIVMVGPILRWFYPLSCLTQRKSWLRRFLLLACEQRDMEMQKHPIHSYAKVVGEEGQRKSVGRWGRATLCVKKAYSRDWFQRVEQLQSCWRIKGCVALLLLLH